MDISMDIHIHGKPGTPVHTDTLCSLLLLIIAYP